MVFFRSDAGNEPVRTWLRELAKDERKSIGEDITNCPILRGQIGKPLVDSLGKGLWEIRSNLRGKIARTLFVVQGQEIVLPIAR